MPTGVYDHSKRRKPRELRVCVLPDCSNTFECKVDSKKRYCGRKCANLKKKSKESNRKTSEALKRFYRTEEGGKVKEKLQKQNHNPDCSCCRCKASRHEKRGPMPEEIKKKIRSTKRKNNKDKYEVRVCIYRHCDITFECLRSSDKKYCSISCSGKDKPRRKRIKPREVRICNNPNCKNTFGCYVNSDRKYCCLSCAHEVIVKSEERNKKIGMAVMEFWQDPEQKEKRVRAIMKGVKIYPTNPEKELNRFLQQFYPNQWKYVGDGQFTLAGKTPDFININGQKKIIEMNGDWWHGEKFTGRTKEEEEQQRIDLFAKEGYQTLIIWEHELKDIKKLKVKLQEFSNEFISVGN